MTSICSLWISHFLTWWELLCLRQWQVAFRGKYLVKAKTDWIEPTNIYAIMVSEPSERKSAVTSLIVKPINLYDMEYNKQHSAALEKNRMQKRIFEKRQRAIEDKVAGGMYRS